MPQNGLPIDEIVLADNQTLTAKGIRYLLEKRNNTRISEAVSKSRLFGTLNDDTSLVIIDYLCVQDFIITDIMSLKKSFPSIPVLVVTADQETSTIKQVLQTNVHGFLFKDCSDDELIRATDSVIKGDKFFSNKVVDILMSTHQPTVAEPLHELTAREVDIIKLVVSGQSTVEIATNLFLSPHTISTHRKNILRKLKIKSPVELVTYAYDRGWIKSK